MDGFLDFLKAADTPIALGISLAIIIWQFRDRKADRRMIISNQRALIGLLEKTMGGKRIAHKSDSDEPQEAKT